tara:strand:- start:139 stop:444 length:306 start_codon:yes stop_codon:yes gene_type:complete
MNLEISKDDLLKILNLSNYYFEGFSVKLILADETIHFEASLEDSFLECAMYIDENCIYLSTNQIRTIYKRLEDYERDVLTVEDNTEQLTAKDWQKKLEYFN